MTKIMTGVVPGSASELEVMRHAVEQPGNFGIPYAAKDDILDMCLVSARISYTSAAAATRIARQIAALLGYCGVITVEFLVLEDGSLLVNEIVPYPDNSGYYTLDACLNFAIRAASTGLVRFVAGRFDPVSSGCHGQSVG